MNTFKFTMPEPSLTKHEKEGKKQKESLGHSDYIRAFLGFGILFWILSYVLGRVFIYMPVENSLIVIVFFLVILAASYMSFFCATRRYLVARLRAGPCEVGQSDRRRVKL